MSVYTPISKFDGNGADIAVGTRAEERFEQAFNDLNQQQTEVVYKVLRPTHEQDCALHVDRYVEKYRYSDQEFLKRIAFQVKAKSTPQFCVAELRRGNYANGWLLASEADYLAEEKPDRFWCVKMGSVKAKVEQMWGKGVFEDLATLEKRYNCTDDKTAAILGAQRLAGYEPALYLKDTEYRREKARDVLIYIPISMFAKHEYIEFQARPLSAMPL